MLACNSVSFEIKNKRILQNINFQARGGEILSILGQNGAGKSTLFKILTGQIKPILGDVQIENRNLHTLKTQEISQMCVLMGQSFNVSFNFTAIEVIKMGFFGTKFHEEILQKAIKLTNCEGLLGEVFQSLSCGQQQKVMLAKAIARLHATKASVLLLDEPSSSADIKNEIATMKIIKNLANEGICVLMINHNIKLALKYSHSFLLLKDGEVFLHASEVSKTQLAQCFDVEENYF